MPDVTVAHYESMLSEAEKQLRYCHAMREKHWLLFRYGEKRDGKFVTPMGGKVHRRDDLMWCVVIGTDYTDPRDNDKNHPPFHQTPGQLYGQP